uniref:Retinol dehydrogenase 13 n=1 Tax=Romanomermis culicivorax TaxID=13658 RepID=A0A915JYP4_ROMCU
DGHELTWQTNYLSHFLLTELLLPLLKESGDESRIVNVSSRAHFGAGQINLETVDRREGYETRDAYSRSKLAQVMHAAYMTKLLRLEGSPVTINACHPGIVYTRIMRHTPFATNSILRACLAPVAWFALKTPKDGAQCPVYCALSKELNGVSGKYAAECKIQSANELVKDEKLCKELYEYSKRACGLEKDE